MTEANGVLSAKRLECSVTELILVGFVVTRVLIALLGVWRVKIIEYGPIFVHSIICFLPLYFYFLFKLFCTFIVANSCDYSNIPFLCGTASGRDVSFPAHVLAFSSDVSTCTTFHSHIWKSRFVMLNSLSSTKIVDYLLGMVHLLNRCLVMMSSHLLKHLVLLYVYGKSIWNMLCI